MGNKLASLSAGPRGPLLLQDHVLIDEMAHFDRERIPERVVHAKGAGTSNVTIALNLKGLFRLIDFNQTCYQLHFFIKVY